MDARTSMQKVVVEATVIRADGSREALGVIAEIIPEKNQTTVKSILKRILGGK